MRSGGGDSCERFLGLWKESSTGNKGKRTLWRKRKTEKERGRRRAGRALRNSTHTHIHILCPLTIR